MRGLSPGTIAGIRSGKVWSSTSFRSFPFSLTVLSQKEIRATLSLHFSSPLVQGKFKCTQQNGSVPLPEMLSNRPVRDQ